MALPVRDQVKYWGIALALFVLVLWYLGDVLLPFVLGGAVAYFLDPVADRLERMGLSRVAATTVISLVVVLAVFILLIEVIPAVIQQLVNLIDTLPELYRQLRSFLATHIPSLFDTQSTTHQALQSFGETLRDKAAVLAQGVFSSAMSLINVVILLVIVPVVAFYLLLDWDRMVAEVDSLLPRDHVQTIRRLAKEIDNTLSAFVRGMGTVCLVLGTYYAVALMLVGLQFGLVVGMIAGAVTFIPYVGAILGGALAIGLGAFQFWGDWVSLGLVAGIFVVGQVIEGNVLTPKLVGSSVGLHPVWLILALSVFGALFGFVGMLIAVPVAAAIGVLTRFMVSQYRGSRLYLGLSTAESEADD
ncbi:AI-2E family transporter [Shimia biformata]|uniref:AI-2E family transporter n=1 Tax=Shimia biformata TaxID=1294299 RepID=UPI00194E68AB|nr:AI-2E family transporter [Shimia biformata]